MGGAGGAGGLGGLGAILEALYHRAHEKEWTTARPTSFGESASNLVTHQHAAAAAAANWVRSIPLLYHATMLATTLCYYTMRLLYSDAPPTSFGDRAIGLGMRQHAASAAAAAWVRSSMQLQYY